MKDTQTTAMTVQPAAQTMAMVTEADLEHYKRQAEILFKSGLMPRKFENPEQIIITALFGRELGISFQRAANEIQVIEGKPTASANLQLALIRERRPQAVIHIKETTADRCVIEASRNPDEPLSTFTFTRKEAEAAGMVYRHKSGAPNTWMKHPEDMCFARAVTRMARRLFGDVMGGISYTPEEMLDARPTEGTALAAAAGGGAVPKRGPVVDVVAEPVPALTEPADFKALDRLTAILEMAATADEGEAGYQAWTRETHSKATLTAGWEIWQDWKPGTQDAPERTQKPLDKEPAAVENPTPAKPQENLF